jgi:hypothetical protein
MLGQPCEFYLPKVAAAWAGLLGDDALLVSFCGAPLDRNWGLDARWRGGGGSFHVDRGAYYHPALVALNVAVIPTHPCIFHS